MRLVSQLRCPACFRMLPIGAAEYLILHAFRPQDDGALRMELERGRSVTTGSVRGLLCEGSGLALAELDRYHDDPDARGGLAP